MIPSNAPTPTTADTATLMGAGGSDHQNVLTIGAGQHVGMSVRDLKDKAMTKAQRQAQDRAVKIFAIEQILTTHPPTADSVINRIATNGFFYTFKPGHKGRPYDSAWVAACVSLMDAWDSVEQYMGRGELKEMAQAVYDVITIRCQLRWKNQGYRNHYEQFMYRQVRGIS